MITFGKLAYRSYSSNLNKLGDVEEEEDDLPDTVLSGGAQSVSFEENGLILLYMCGVCVCVCVF